MRGEVSRKMEKEKILVTKSSMPKYDVFIEMIKPLWETHWLTNMGEYHGQLENQLKDYLKVSGISLMVNGHMALELAIQAFSFAPGSEIITTPFTFISTTHAIVRNGYKPVFCDVKEIDGTIDESKIEALITEKTVAILPVHVYGNVCNVESIEKIADKYNLKVIYDAAHAFGVEYKGKGIGSFGDASIFSFHATKVFNTIEGGAVTFSDPGMYKKLYNLKNFGIRSPEIVSEVGANAKMNEMCAIMGLCNMERIDTVFAARKKRVDYYEKLLKDISNVTFINGNDNGSRNYAYFPILIGNDQGELRDKVYAALENNYIFARKYFYPITSDQACFKNGFRNIKLDVARSMSNRVLVLPLYEDLEMSDIDRIVDIIEKEVTN